MAPQTGPFFALHVSPPCDKIGPHWQLGEGDVVGECVSVFSLTNWESMFPRLKGATRTPPSRLQKYLHFVKFNC